MSTVAYWAAPDQDCQAIHQAFDDLERMSQDGSFDRLTKKEALMLTRAAPERRSGSTWIGCLMRCS
jgi:hypothetical protein